MTTYEVGQKVILRDVNEDRRWYPAGEPPTATITKVGRTLIHVTDDRWPTHPAVAYRIEDGSKNRDMYGGWCQTIEAFKVERDRSLILTAFRDYGIDLSGRRLSDLTNDQLERMLIVAGGSL